MNINFKSILPHLLTIIFAVVLSIFYFYPQLEGKITVSGDSSAYVGASKELKDFKKETGEVSLWTNSVFSGMPAYQISLGKNKNFVQYFNRIGMLFIPKPMGFYIFGILAFYFSLVLLKINPWVSFFGAVCFAFNTYSLVLYDAGHFTKINAIIPMMPIIAGVILTFRKKYLLGLVVFGIGLSLSINNNHYQMTYYLGILLGVFIIVELIKAIKLKALKPFFKASVYLLIGCVLAVGSNTSKILTTNEYGKDTMRGTPILEKKSDVVKSSSEKNGLEWNYAMGWSNGVLDVVASYIPGVIGGSSSEPISSNSATAKEYRKYNQRAERAPLYWGEMISTAGPAYFGAVLMFLFILSFFVLDIKTKISFGVAILVGVFISLGDAFEVFNRVLFDYLPLFNKFRSHGSIMAVIIVLVSFMGVLGLSKIISSTDKEKYIKKLYISAAILGFISLFFMILGSSIFDFTGNSDIRYSQSGFNVDAFVQDRISLMKSDAFRSLVFVFLSAGVLWLFLKNRIQLIILMPVLILLAFVDISSVGKRYLNNSDFVNKKRVTKQFLPTAADLEILKDKDPNYRVANHSGSMYSENNTSYFHKSIGGYHPAKLQRYQDLIDRHLSKNNMNAYNMLNTKYFIMPSENKKPVVQQNAKALGNAWFVDNIKFVASANDELKAISSIDPKSEAAIHKEFETELKMHKPSVNGKIELIEYAPNHLTYTSQNDVESLAVFSEIWYGPDKGWKAIIDGKEVNLLRANYLLRAMMIPKGTHKIEMIFDPLVDRIGDIFNMIFSSILLILLGFVTYREMKTENS